MLKDSRRAKALDRPAAHERHGPNYFSGIKSDGIFALGLSGIKSDGIFALGLSGIKSDGIFALGVGCAEGVYVP